MPRFCRFLPGPLVTTSPQVINGAASPGQQCCSGNCPRSTSPPSRRFVWQGALPTILGVMLQTCLSIGNLSQASLSPRGGSGSFSSDSTRPISRKAEGSSAPMPRATLRVVPNKFTSAGCLLGSPNRVGRSMRSAGPAFRRQASASAVISNSVAISGLTRCNSPSS